MAIPHAFAQPTIRIQVEKRPIISRFRGFVGIAEQSHLGRIDPGSFRLYVNGENHSKFLRLSTESETRNIVLSYKPIKALKDGKNTFKLLATTLDEKTVERSWIVLVDPALDPDLAPFVRAIKKNPNNPDPHLQLAKGYEKKFLMEDAQEEYKRILEINPRQEEAKHAYDRIFASWGRKAIVKRGVIIDVTLEEGLIGLGGPILFKVVIENTTPSHVIVSKKIYLLDSQGNQIEPWQDLATYPKKALDQGKIPLDDYARLSYQLESKPFPLLTIYELLPKVSASGYLAFQLQSVEAHRLILVFSKITIKGKATEFHFPFTRQ